MPAQRTFLQRVGLAFRYRLIQVLLASICYVLLIAISARVLIPKQQTKADVDKSGGYKYMHCNKCNFEVPYQAGKENTVIAGCKCKKPVVGYWVATLEKLPKEGNAVSPNKWFNTSVLVGFLIYLFTIYYLLSQKVEERISFYLKCFHCGELLRYGKTGFGLFVKCPNCQNLLKLPDEEESLTQEDYEESMAETTVEEYQLRLRAAGYKFPGDEVPSEQTAPDVETANPQAPPSP